MQRHKPKLLVTNLRLKLKYFLRFLLIKTLITKSNAKAEAIKTIASARAKEA